MDERTQNQMNRPIKKKGKEREGGKWEEGRRKGMEGKK